MGVEQPKKPVGGAFGIFLAEKRPEYLKACAGQKASAVSGMAGAAWKKLSEAQKAPYQKKYEEAKAKFDKDMADFLAAGGVKEKGATAQRKERKLAKEGKLPKKKDPDAPKKPAGGGYGQYLKENRAKIAASLPKDHKMTDVGKKAGEDWRKFSEAQKKPYNDKYEKAMAAYKKEFEEYKKKNPAAEDEDNDEDAEAEEKIAEEKAKSPAKRGRGAAKSKDVEEPKAKKAKKIISGGA
eukprot:TRINITY_DN650_c0_g1_i1.p1 TRINITY_DN650_c0_g1~~TRINITY_DN650_c0_g1_i1.p1  ORF type:complete len:238 (+),score=104.34 TRINITY_DN650_c0_g1_i1:149-862(+)